MTPLFLFLGLVIGSLVGIHSGRYMERTEAALKGPGLKLCAGESLELGGVRWTATAGEVVLRRD